MPVVVGRRHDRRHGRVRLHHPPPARRRAVPVVPGRASSRSASSSSTRRDRPCSARSPPIWSTPRRRPAPSASGWPWSCPSRSPRAPPGRPTPADLLARPSAALATPPDRHRRRGDRPPWRPSPSQHRSVPVTLQVSGQTVGLLDTPAHQTTINQLGQLAATPQVHQLTSAPFTPVDAAALVDSGLADRTRPPGGPGHPGGRRRHRARLPRGTRRAVARSGSVDHRGRARSRHRRGAGRRRVPPAGAARVAADRHPDRRVDHRPVHPGRRPGHHGHGHGLRRRPDRPVHRRSRQPGPGRPPTGGRAGPALLRAPERRLPPGGPGRRPVRMERRPGLRRRPARRTRRQSGDPGRHHRPGSSPSSPPRPPAARDAGSWPPADPVGLPVAAIRAQRVRVNGFAVVGGGRPALGLPAR